MNLNDVKNEVARRADTCGTQISAAVVARVLGCLYDVLRELGPCDLLAVLGKIVAPKRK